ncbi:hypothetical protein ACFSUS_16475 [Spirosoma soli]|uniref:Uncharacterized protein n=1 Tax=Spirosoma soli TaxID=1770529 RepID=A0ABW5M6D2_9BACT
MLGYIFFAITVLFYVGLALFTASKPSLVGENAMGYGLGLAFFGLGFAVSSLVLTITLITTGKVSWVANEAEWRTTIVLVAWLFVVLTTFFCAIFKWEWHSDADNTYPQFLHGLAVGHGLVWIPLLWLVACFLSLNTSWQANLSLIVLKSSFFAALAISGLYSGGLLLGYVRDSARQSEAEMARRKEQENQWHQQTLDFIASQKPEDSILGLLVHTNQFRENDIRQAALAKIKAHPDWEADILALLKNEHWYREVYTFLDGNRVTRSREFAEALNQSVARLAGDVVDNIQNSNNLQPWSFDSYGISELLRAIDEQFGEQGVDFRPNVRKLQQALKTTPPERFRDVTFNATHEVDAWLAKQNR